MSLFTFEYAGRKVSASIKSFSKLRLDEFKKLNY
jgi:hypothetical protein